MNTYKTFCHKALEDDKIIELFDARSEKAIQELSSKYGELCRKISYNILNDWQDVEECINDAYLGIWNRIPPERPNPLAAYVCRIVRNISLKKSRYNLARKRNSSYDISIHELEECIPAGRNPNPHAQESLTEAIERFLDSLDQNSRVMLIKRYWYADSVSEIAHVFGMRENSVSAKLMRLRRKLKKYLEQEGIRL